MKTPYSSNTETFSKFLREIGRWEFHFKSVKSQENLTDKQKNEIVEGMNEIRKIFDDDWLKNAVITRHEFVDYLNDKNIRPFLYTMPKEEIKLEQKRKNQKMFEDNVPISLEALFSFYARKNVYYVQIGGRGFYHLEKDVAGLGTPQLDGELKLRFRAKTHHSKPVHKYSFFAVLKFAKSPTSSRFDIEDKKGRIFPNIKPEININDFNWCKSDMSETNEKSKQTRLYKFSK